MNTLHYREITNSDSLLREDEPYNVAGHNVRPVSLASMLVLKKLGNPLYNAIMGEDRESLDALGTDLEVMTEFVWVHAAPWPDVRRLAVRADYSREQVAEAILDYISTLPQDAMGDIVRLIIEQANANAAATARALPREGQPSSKN